MAKKNRTRRTAFVPSVVFGTVFASVVPACVLGACGGDDAQVDGQDAARDHALRGEGGVADAGFQPDYRFSVDAACFACDTTQPDASLGHDGDASDAADATDGSDAALGVADVGFGS